MAIDLNIDKSAEKLVGSFMNIKTPAGKETVKKAKKLFKEGRLPSGKIRKKLIKNRFKII